jgi:electron transfer flavoprotein alpha subunit
MEQNDASLEMLTVARKFGSELHAVRMDAVQPFSPDSIAALLARVADDLNATAVLAAGTDRGNDVMARLAARAGLPFAANCIVAEAGDPLLLTRLRWGDSLWEMARMHTPRPIITVPPHTFPIVDGPAAADVDVKALIAQLDDRDRLVQVSEHIPTAGGGVSLTEARVVVSGGRGVGSKEGFAIIEELAGLLGGAVGCSRVVTSAGWRPHTDQVGQTGTKIAPDLYIACGISGATQHMAGCRNAKRILAINSDAEAPIMANADYAVIGDLKEILPAISAEIRKLR